MKMNLQFAICNFSIFQKLNYCISMGYKNETDEKIANCKLQIANSPIYILKKKIYKTYVNIPKASRRHPEGISKEYRRKTERKNLTFPKTKWTQLYFTLRPVTVGSKVKEGKELKGVKGVNSLTPLNSFTFKLE